MCSINPAWRAGPPDQRPSVHPSFFFLFQFMGLWGFQSWSARGSVVEWLVAVEETYWHPAGGHSGGRKTPPSEDGGVGFPPSVCVFWWSIEADSGTLEVNSLGVVLLFFCLLMWKDKKKHQLLAPLVCIQLFVTATASPASLYPWALMKPHPFVRCFREWPGEGNTSVISQVSMNGCMIASLAIWEFVQNCCLITCLTHFLSAAFWKLPLLFFFLILQLLCTLLLL